MSASPLISVVLPVYNRSEFLTDAIDSILNQTLTDFELLIVNDGSSNAECLRIISNYEKRDKRIHVFHQKNGGLACARNTGISNARGQYIATMDDDDISHLSRLEKQAEFLNEHPDVAVVIPSIIHINSHGHSIKEQTASDFKPRIYKPHERQSLITIGDVCLGPAAMYRANILKQCKFRTFFIFAEDTDITLRFAEKYSIATLPTNLYFYRAHGKSTPSLSSNEQMLYYLLSASLFAQYRRQGKSEPLSDITDVLNLIPLFKELPTVVICTILQRLWRISKRLLYNRQYDRLGALLANMDKAFLDSEHAEAYGRIRRKNLRELALKALQRGHWGWLARRTRKHQPIT